MSTPNLRLAVIDYAKQWLATNDTAVHMLSDMVCQKQINYERTVNTLITTDKHDMIGTHFLIYDTQDLYKPRLVAAIRNTYEDRAKHYGVPLPIDLYFANLNAKAQSAVLEFRKRKPMLVDCNAWFVDPEYSKANSNLNLSEILFFASCLFIYRLGHDHMAGATNERYKASRWVEKVGHFPDGLTFMHPTIPFIHKLELIEEFNPDWLRTCWNQYEDLMRTAYEAVPKSVPLASLDEVVARFARRQTHLRAA